MEETEETIWRLIEHFPNERDTVSTKVFNYLKQKGYTRFNCEELLDALLRTGTSDPWQRFLFPSFPFYEKPTKIVRASGSWSEGLNDGQNYAYKGLISEVDFMFTLGMTGNRYDPLVLEVSADPGYYVVRINEPYMKSERFLENLCVKYFDHYYLSPMKTVNYVEGIIRQAFLKGEIKKQMSDIDAHNCPATTLKFSDLPFERPYKSRDLILDIVPVLESQLKLEHVDMPFFNEAEKALVQEKLILLVAKSCSHPLQWRASTSLAEREIFRQITNSAINLVLIESKIFKAAFLPKEARIKSYHLKTVLLHWLREYPTLNGINWTSEYISEKVVELFDRLRKYIEVGFLPHFFFRNINLLADVDVKSSHIKDFCEKVRNREKFTAYFKRYQTIYTTRHVIFDDHEDVFEPLLNREITRISAALSETNIWFDHQQKLEQIMSHINELVDENNLCSILQKCLELAIITNNCEAIEYLLFNERVKQSINILNVLQFAIRQGNEKLTKEILAQNINVNDNQCGMTPLLLSVTHDHISIVNLLLNNGADVNIADEYGRTPLMTAVSNSNAELVSILLANKAAVNQCHNCGLTSLHIACRKGDIEIVRLLVSYGSNVNSQAEVSSLKVLNPLLCTIHGMISSLVTEAIGQEIIETLLKHGAHPNPSKLPSVEVPLVSAAECGYLEIVKLLLTHGANVNIARGCGSTPLHKAAAKGHDVIVKVLLKYQASKEVLDKNGFTPVMSAAIFGKFQMVKLLADAGADISQKSYLGSTALTLATSFGFTQVVKTLQEVGALKDVEQRQEAFLIASSNCYLDIVEMLMQSGFDISSDIKNRALILAAAGGSVDVCKFLLANDALINAKNEKGWTALRNAIVGGYFDIVQQLVECGANVNAVENNGLSCLHIACGLGHAEIAKYLIAKGAHVGHKRGIDTNLWFAARHSHVEIVKLLLELDSNDIDINYCGEDGSTALILSVQKQDMEMAQLLLQHGANVNQPNSLDVTPLSVAASNGQLEIVSLLLQYKAEVNSLNFENHTPLYYAIVSGHSKVVSLLLQHGAIIDQYEIKNEIKVFSTSTALNIYNCISKNCDPLLIIAVDGNYFEIAEMLLKHGINANQEDKNGNTALCIAVKRGDANMTSLLLNFHVDIDYQTRNDDTALLLAIKQGHSIVVQLLLEHGADANKRNSSGISPLLLAQHLGYTDIMSLLLKFNASVEGFADDTTTLILAVQDQNVKMVQLLLGYNAKTSVRNSRGATPLCLAVHLNNVDILLALLESKADVDYSTSTGDTALVFAVQQGYLNIATLLLEYGANVNTRNLARATPLAIAIHRGDVEMMFLLRHHKADLFDCSPFSDTAVLWAILQGQTNMAVSLLSEKDVDDIMPKFVNASNADGIFPLLAASIFGCFEIVKLLTRLGASVTIMDNSGNTPLHMAVYYGHNDIVQYFLESVPTLDIRNKNGATPLWLAADQGHSDIVKLLVKHCADVSVCDLDGVTAFKQAAKRGHVNVVEVLLQLKFPVCMSLMTFTECFVD